MNFTFTCVPFCQIYILAIVLSILAKESFGQNCKFEMQMGDKYNKCSAVCLGRSYKCVADGTCLCQPCPNGKSQSYVHTFDDTSCESNQECTRKCMDANTEPDFDGNIGIGKKCEFTDDFYATKSSVCVCGCL